MSRTDYHREYYWANVEKRREQRRLSKRGMCEPKLRVNKREVSKLMRLWK